MHCLRLASSRLLSPSPRISVLKSSRVNNIIPTHRISRPLSAHQSRWNSSNESPATPIHNLKDVQREESKSDVESQATLSENEETSVPHRMTEMEAIQEAYIPPGKREMRMHTLNAQMQEQSGNYGPRESDTIYVGNLFYDVEAEDLRTRMEEFGTVVRAFVVHDNRGLSKGFGYVQFNTIEEARYAIENMHLQVFEGRQVVVQFSHSQLRRDISLNPPSNTLFIGNVPYELTDRDIQTLFADIRNVVDIRFSVDRRSGAPRGFCHAEFLGVEAAMQAREKLLLKEPYGRKLKVEFATRKKVSFMAGENVKAQERREWERQQYEENE